MKKQIILCKCKGEIQDKNKISDIEVKLKNSHSDVFFVSDFCGICALEKEKVKSIISADTKTLIIACHKRSVESLLHFSGVDKDNCEIEYVDPLIEESDTIENKIVNFCGNERSSGQKLEVESKPEWPSWFPVIDYNRCVDCGQCADFCLFGTYEKRDGKVIVTNPQACKNNCPACGRICPQSAIIFPKYPHGGAISGTDSIDEVAEQERQQKDMDRILGSDIYRTLAERKAKRQRIIKNEAMEQAMQERNDALKKEKKGKIRFNPFGE